MIRALLEKLGIVEPRDPEEGRVRTEALETNAAARKVIHDSRERRAILQLRLEHIQRTNGRHR